jgi:hypothetical protein
MVKSAERSPAKWLKDNQYAVRAAFWGAMAIPTLIWWRDSVALVLVISLATQIDTSLGAHEARKARKEGNGKTD